MSASRPSLAERLPRLVAIAIPLLVYGFTRLPEPSPEARAEAAERFRFERSVLSEVGGSPQRFSRSVHPSLEHISAWISAVGAAVALTDLDGDGLANDVCQVETRTDQVVVTTVPAAERRFEPFALHPDGLPYDASATAPMGCLPGDYDEDGWTDLLVYYWGRPPIVFLRSDAGAAPDRSRRRPPSRAAYTPVEVASGSERWFTNAATRADVDGDGHIDLVVGNYFQDGADVLGGGPVGQRMQTSMSRAGNGGRNRLLLWRSAASGAAPRVEFRDASDALPEATRRAWTLAVGAADLDGDLLPELYFANDFGPDRLLHNRSSPGRPRLALVEGRKRLTTPSSKVLGRDSFKGMGVDFADLNHDGLLDIYVSNIAEEWALEESHFAFVSTGRPELLQDGVAPYVERSEPLGLSRSAWAWESRLADFDNDGVAEAVQATGFVKGTIDRWPELHELAMANDFWIAYPDAWLRVQPGDDLSGDAHNPFFVRVGKRFVDVASELGIDQPQVSRGIATADWDGDGDLDFAVANQWEASHFYRNDQTTANRALQLRLLHAPDPGADGEIEVRPEPMPAAPGRPVIGAVATVALPDGRRLTAQVDGGNGHSGVRSPELHLGLGGVPAGQRLQVDLRWRDPMGGARAARIGLTPGRHTVVLGWAGESRERRQ